VTLDARPIPTPARNTLAFNSEALAWAVAAEWDNQTTDAGIEPTFMPLMSLASTAIDQIAPHPEGTIATLMPYLKTDTACFRAPDDERVLRQRQDDALTPLLDWVMDKYGAELSISDNIVQRRAHDPAAEDLIRQALLEMDEFQLASLQCATANCKSLVLGLALVEQRVGPSEAHNACRLEEDFQMEQWGLVEGGHDVDQAASLASLASASTFLRLHSL